MTKNINLTSKIRSLKNSKVVVFLTLWITSGLILITFVFTEYLKNYNYLEIFPKELLFACIINAAASFIVALTIFIFTTRNGFAAKIISCVLFSLLLVNYDTRLLSVAGIFKTFIPILPGPGNDIAVISLMFLTILAIISIYAGRYCERIVSKAKNLTNSNLIFGTFIFVTVMAVGQAAPTFSALRVTADQSTYTPTAELSQDKVPDSNENANANPDIYYIVLDRYTNNNVLKNQLNFDNSTFLNNLRSRGFAVDENASSQYPYTTASIASVLNMSYHDDDLENFKNNTVQSATLFHSMNRQGEVIKLLKQQGYEYYSIGSSYGASNKAPLANVDFARSNAMSIFGKIKLLRGIEVSQYNQSVFYRFSKMTYSWSPLKLTEIDLVGNIKNQLNLLEDIAATKKGGRFIFAHILVPHDPYLFNSDGSLANDSGVNNSGRLIKNKYVDQIKFINTQIDSIISKIDNNAVVLLISDEGPYPVNLNQTVLKGEETTASQSDYIYNADMTKWSTEDLKMKFGILQAARIPKATDDQLSKISPVNAFRIVLNTYFGYQYIMLPNCQKALPEGRKDLYTYSDITYKFTDTKSDVCTK